MYGTLEYAPIHYINQSIPQDELIAIYHLADACLVTSVRDGMNLVSHEYVAAQAALVEPAVDSDDDSDDDLDDDARENAQTPRPSVVEAGAGYSGADDVVDDAQVTAHKPAKSKAAKSRESSRSKSVGRRASASVDTSPGFRKDGPGTLVLSEFAGSAQSLSGAIRVNPWNTGELAHAIHTSLTLSRVERELRWAKLERYVSNNTASYWARSFVSEFRDVCEHPPLLPKLPRLNAAEVLRAYERARARLIVADYDGTLTQIQSLPQLATPAPVVTQLLATLARDDRNTCYVMSGRERRFMDKWLGNLRVGLAAEFGFCHRAPDDPPGEWKSLGRELDTSWKDVVRPIMQYSAERTPGTYIESKESSLAWHYRDADPHFGAWQAKDMQIHMEDVLANLPLEIIQGNRLVECRHVGVNKSLVLEEVLRQGPRRQPLVQDDDAVATTRRAQLSDDREAETDAATHAAQQQPQAVLRLSRVFSFSPFPFEKRDFMSPRAPPFTLPPPQAPEFDFVLCVGDDRSDEDMYQLLKTYHSQRVDALATAEANGAQPARKPAVYLVHIGTGATHAEFYLDNIIELRKILRGMAAISLKDEPAGGPPPQRPPAQQRRDL